MDPLTHSAVGLFLGRAGLNRACPHATWVLVLAANAPDIDILSLAGGSLGYLNYHRHWTHSLAGWPVMALLPVLLVRVFTRRPFPWRSAYLIALAAVASHLLLDATNPYGIRWLLPFSGRWFYLDLTAVVDLWIWAALLIAIAAPALVGLVNTEIGARSTAAQRGFAIFALLFICFYNGGRAVLHARAISTLESRIYRGVAARRLAALPSPTNPFHWRGIVETPDFYSLQEFSLLEQFDPSRGTLLYKAELSPAISAANHTSVFRDFFNFSRFPFEQTLPAAEPEGAIEVEAQDLRFGIPAHPAFLATALVTNRQQVIRSWFQFGRLRPR
jgi:inner membrane protein